MPSTRERKERSRVRSCNYASIDRILEVYSVEKLVGSESVYYYAGYVYAVVVQRVTLSIASTD